MRMPSEREDVFYMMLSVGYPELAAYYYPEGVGGLIKEIRSLPSVVDACHIQCSCYHVFVTLKGLGEKINDTIKTIRQMQGKGVMNYFVFSRTPEDEVSNFAFGPFSKEHAEQIGKRTRENIARHEEMNPA